MCSTPAALETVSEFGQCIIAGRSITPSVPAMRAVQVRFTRMPALTTPSLPSGWCSNAVTISSTPVSPTTPSDTTRSIGPRTSVQSWMG